MKKFIFILSVISVLIIGLTAYSKSINGNPGKKYTSNGVNEAAVYNLSEQEAKVSYDEIIYDDIAPGRNTIKISNNFGSLDIYGRNEDKVRFEIDCYCDKKNEKQNCCYSIERSKNEIIFISKHNTSAKKMNIKVFVPQSIREMILVNKNGDMSVLNDLHTNINLKVEEGNVNIHSLYGGVISEILKGNISFRNTVISDETNINTLKGNIKFEGQINKGADISINTDFGSIEMDVDEASLSHGIFYNGIMESKKMIDYDPDSNIKLNCYGGKIIFSK